MSGPRSHADKRCSGPDRRLFPDFCRAFGMLMAACLVSFSVVADKPATITAAPSATPAKKPESVVLHGQRQQFKALFDALSRGQTPAIPASLDDYPIRYYLDFAAIAAGFDRHTVAANSHRVRAFMQAHPDSPAATRLRHRYLSWLASHQHWAEYRRFYQPAGATLSEQCHALWAEITATGASVQSLAPRIQSLWLSGHSRPSACDLLFTWWKNKGGITPELWQKRFDLAYARRNGSLAHYLAGQMTQPPPWVDRALDLLKDPLSALTASLRWPVNEKNRWLVYQTALYQAKKTPAAMRSLWPKLQRHFGFDASQRRRVEYRMALFAATDYAPFSFKAMQALPKDWQDDQLRAWRVRYWLQQQRWRQVAREIEAMPKTQRNRDRWRYWLARAYAKTGKGATARKLFHDLAQNADYYGFLAADHLRLPYQICQQDSPVPANAHRWQAPPAIERAIELYHAGLVDFAKREWNTAYSRLSRADKLSLAGRVQAEGWHNKLMAIMGDTGHWKDYRRRFPRDQTEHIRQKALARQLSPEWVMAVIRSESGWDPHAESRAQARGLMQLIDSTARRLSKKLGLSYLGATQLFDPVFNTTLGIAYQRELYDRYQNQPLLAAAAYNAGESAAEKWLTQLPPSPDLWLETIPYRETRDYVTRILAYTVIYDWLLNQKPRRITHFMPTLPIDGQAIKPWPSRSLPRQFAEVVCRAPRSQIRVVQQAADKN